MAPFIKSLDRTKYEMNKDKLSVILGFNEFFEEKVVGHGGKIITNVFDGKFSPGSLTAEFKEIDFSVKDTEILIELLKHCSKVMINSQDNGIISVSVSVDGLFDTIS